jgi:hypothetical protein
MIWLALLLCLLVVAAVISRVAALRQLLPARHLH